MIEILELGNCSNRLLREISFWQYAEMFRHHEVADKHAANIRNLLDRMEALNAEAGFPYASAA